MKDIMRTISEFILAELMPGEPASALTDDTPLRTSGIVDSMATLKLVSFIETRWNVELAAHETGIENFDRVIDIATLVQRKLTGS